MDTQLDAELRANILVEALPYIQEYYGQTVVVKYGGNAMINEELKDAVIHDLVLLNLVGVKVVIVHGGGPEINEMLGKIGKESKFVNGLRYTDRETMDIVQMVLCGKVNKDLVTLLEKAGGRGIGLGGMDGGLFQAKRLTDRAGTDYGYVGDIMDVDPAPVIDVLQQGYIPVVSTVAQGIDDETNYNINADTAASKLAVALGAKKLILLTDVRGLMLDPDVVIADEPVSALDVSVRAQVLNLMMDLQQDLGLSYVFISHDLSVVEHIADEVMVMYLGRCVEKGTKEQIFNNPRHPYTQALLSATPRLNPDDRRERIKLTGELPSPLNPPPGCAFNARCRRRFGPCTQLQPQLKDYGGQLVACFAVDQDENPQKPHA